MLADCRVALPFKRGIDERKLPRRRCLLGKDAVTPAEEVQVLGLIADLRECGKSGTDVKIHVTEIRMLRHMEANGNRSWIAVARSEEVQVLGLIADLRECGKSGTDVKIHVTEIRMLRHMEANGNRSWIAVADLEIDVAHR